MQHLIERIRRRVRRRGERIAAVGATARTAAAALAVLVAACAPPAAVAQSDSSFQALRAPASAVESSATRATAPQRATTVRVVAARVSDGASAATVGHPTTAMATTTTATAGAAAGVLRGSAWRGEYAAQGLARRADLALTIGPAEDDAVVGELALRVVRDGDTFDDGDAASRASIVAVPIARATASGGGVELVTAPFVDPACGCTVTGTFTGTVRGDAIEGRFSLRGAPTMAPHRGRWRATRVPVAVVQGGATSPEE